jgi:hypothetical protein
MEFQREIINDLKLKNEDLTAKVLTLEQRMSDMESSHTPISSVPGAAPSDLMHRVDDLEQYTRRNNVVVTGVPMIRGEHPYDTASRITNVIDPSVSPNDINSCHWLYHDPKKNQQPKFLIHFIHRGQKNQFLVQSKRMRPTASRFGGSSDERVFVGEHLTRNTARLRAFAKNKLSPLGYIVDTRDCVVFAWKKGERRIKISDENRVNKLASENRPTSITATTQPQAQVHQPYQQRQQRTNSFDASSRVQIMDTAEQYRNSALNSQ